MFYSKITSKGQTTIPMEIRNRLGLTEGSNVIYRISERGDVIMEKDTISTLEQMGIHVFYCDDREEVEDELYYEVFMDKTRKPIEEDKVLEHTGHGREGSFSYMIVRESELEDIRSRIQHPEFTFLLGDEAAKFYHTLGLITSEEFILYHENKKIRDKRNSTM